MARLSWPHWPKGSLPHSLSPQEVFLYRYQANKYMNLGTTWYRMFWDVERKWTAPNRYSGQRISPGHFFAVSPAGARAEMKAYSIDVGDYELLRFEVSIDDLLDLTDIDSLVWFYQKHFRKEYLHWAIILDSLLEQQRGGDDHNDFAGHKALLDGYNGIVFFSARALGDHWPRPGSLDRDLLHDGLSHNSMRRDSRCVNVLIYFGHNVVRGTHSIAFKGGEISNHLFSASNARIDEVFSQDPERPHDTDLTYDSLRSRVERIKWATKPRVGSERR